MNANVFEDLSELKELVVIDGGSKVPPPERSMAAHLHHQLLTARPREQCDGGRVYEIVLRNWKACQA